MLFDSHAHLNFSAFKEDADEVIKECLKNDVWMINVGSQYSTSSRAVEYAQKYEYGVFAAVGLHPIQLQDTEIKEEGQIIKTRAEEFNQPAYDLLARHDKVVAIGETGLDFYRIEGNEKMIGKIRQKQVDTFLQHFKLAKSLDLPLILHCRGTADHPLGAYEQLLAVLDEQGKYKGVIHCYGGNSIQARHFIDLGYYVGFTGVITFDKTGKLAEIIKEIPLEKILIETDCPYLAPEPYRGKRNIPLYVEFMARKIAEIKKIEYKKVAEQTFKNALKVFDIKR